MVVPRLILPACAPAPARLAALACLAVLSCLPAPARAGDALAGRGDAARLTVRDSSGQRLVIEPGIGDRLYAREPGTNHRVYVIEPGIGDRLIVREPGSGRRVYTIEPVRQRD
jgi:hypothetical protein